MAEKALAENLTGKRIKVTIRDRRADHFRG
jgi:hypothetical protein